MSNSQDCSGRDNVQPHQQSNNPYNQRQQNAAEQQIYTPPPGPPPRRTDTFEESSFVPTSERGEQREALEQFEMSKSGPGDSTDRDVATLQQEFPSVDGSLIAAIYSDSQSLAATREMLQELSREGQGSS